MSDVLTSSAVAAQLAQLSRELDALVRSLEVAERDAVNRREDFTMAHSRAFLKAEGAMELRKHQAVVDTHAERLAAEGSEVLVRGLRRQLDSVKTRIDIGRSLGAAIRAEVALTGRDGQS